MQLQQQRVQGGTPNALSSMTGLAKAIALPHDYAPSRFPSYPALERTAVLGFSAPVTWNSTSTNTAERFILTRQASWPLWGRVTSGVTTPLFWVDYTVTTHTSTVQQNTLATAGPIAAWGLGSRPATNLSCGIVGATSIPQGYAILGIDGPGPEWFYTDGNARAYIVGNTDSVNSAGAAGTGILTYQQWVSPGEYKTIQKAVTLQTDNTKFGAFYTLISTTSNQGFWIRPVSYSSQGVNQVATFTAISAFGSDGPAYTTSATVNPTFTYTPTVSTITLQPLVVPSEFANSALPWYSTRTTAAAVLLTNVTQALNKAGTFLGGRVSPNVISPFEVTTTYLSTLHPAEKSQLAAEEGFYTYTPPSTDLVNFWDYTLNTSNGAATCPVYRLDNDSLVNVFFHSDSIAATYSVTVDWHLEFRTTSALFPIGVSSMPIEMLHQAQLALCTTGFFFNNWNHEKIKAIVVNIARYLAANTPYGRMLSGAYGMGKAIMMGRQPRQYTRPTRFPGQGRKPFAGRRGRGKGKGASKAPPPKTAPKRKGGLQMFLDSRK